MCVHPLFHAVAKLYACHKIQIQVDACEDMLLTIHYCIFRIRTAENDGKNQILAMLWNTKENTRSHT